MPWNDRRVPAPKPTTVFAVSPNARERRPRSPAAPPNEGEPLEFELAEEEIDQEPDYLAELEEIEAMPFEEFYRSLRADIDGVREGLIPSIADAEKAKDMKSPKNRPWSRHHKRRDHRGRAF
jgi:hypothetical protein